MAGIILFLGCCVGVLWSAGLNAPGARILVTWVDLFVAVGTIVFAFIYKNSPKNRGTVETIAGSILLVVWASGFLGASVPWQGWWNFGLGCLFCLAAVAEHLKPFAEKRDGARNSWVKMGSAERAA